MDSETVEDGQIDLEQLALRSGQAAAVERTLRPADPVVGGEPFPIEGGTVETRIEISKTTAGYALRLLASTTIGGPCVRCLDPATLDLEIESREVDQEGTDDPELMSPYLEDGILDATSWLQDAIRLDLPEKILCRPDCAGICPECGANLNETGPGHTHEPPLDPRFAKLRELQGED